MPNKHNLNEYFIQGLKIFLREVRIDDVNENYQRWLNDPEVNQYLETRFVPQTKQDIESYVQDMANRPDEIFLAICLAGTDEHIGNIKVGPINPIHRFADISLIIGEKKHWGKGFATESIQLVTKFSFNILNLNKLHAGCYANNIGSKIAFLKVGFKQEGLLKKKRILKGGFQDEIILGLHVDDWRAIK